MRDLFCAYKISDAKVPSYFIASTAPDNVDDKPAPPPALPPQLAAIPADQAIKEIADHLATAPLPNLVVMVHGFNNPQTQVLKAYTAASTAIENDEAIRTRSGLVFIGYRWPSESLGQPAYGTLAALPSLPAWILWLGLILFAIYPVLDFLFRFHAWQIALIGHLPIVVGWTLLGLVVALGLLRAAVYFRDTYRADSYGAPDLIEIIRQIDQAIIGLDQEKEGNQEAAAKEFRDAHRVELSFIGHSMGGFVVTNAIRALSDAFAKGAIRPRLNAGVVDERGHVRPGPRKIGNVFRLTRFVLASPDIPAEALLSGRANFLLSSLHRFDEAFLFSNEGDEVLRLISTTANYISFPTKSWTYGYRLGNVEILSEEYGVITPTPGTSLAQLRIGYYTLQQLYDRLRKASETSPQVDKASQPVTVQHAFAEVFSYFDCTDYVDETQAGAPPTGLLTFALRTKQRDRQARMSWWTHFQLLWSYISRHKPDVHGGYFEGKLCSELIFRLACLGFAGTNSAYGKGMLSKICEAKQIRVLLSPRLQQAPPTGQGAT